MMNNNQTIALENFLIEEKFNDFVEKMRMRMLSYSRRLCGQTEVAEDILQENLLAEYKHSGKVHFENSQALTG